MAPPRPPNSPGSSPGRTARRPRPAPAGRARARRPPPAGGRGARASGAPPTGAAIARAVNEAGENLPATAVPVPPSDKPHPLSCDVLITAEPGKTVTIDTATTNDTALAGK